MQGLLTPLFTAHIATAKATLFATLRISLIGGTNLPLSSCSGDIMSEMAVAATVKNSGSTSLAPEAKTPSPTPGKTKALLHWPM
jgi:hypothetical protein